jgi:hypothetical protein
MQIEYLAIAKYLIVFALFAAGCQIDLVNKSVADDPSITILLHL